MKEIDEERKKTIQEIIDNGTKEEDITNTMIKYWHKDSYPERKSITLKKGFLLKRDFCKKYNMKIKDFNNICFAKGILKRNPTNNKIITSDFNKNGIISRHGKSINTYQFSESYFCVLFGLKNSKNPKNFKGYMLAKEFCDTHNININDFENVLLDKNFLKDNKKNDWVTTQIILYKIDNEKEIYQFYEKYFMKVFGK